MVDNTWETESGLLDDFDFTIEEAWFGKNPKIGDGNVLLLNLRGVAEQDGEVVDDEHLLLYSCGDGWEAGKGGEEAVHNAGKVRFNKSSNMGRLIDAMVELGDEAMEEIKARGQATEAATWVGLRLHIERKEFSYFNRRSNEQVTFEVPLPTDFLGTVDDDEPKKPAKKSGSKAAAKPRTRKAKDADEGEEKPAPKRRRSKAKKEEPEDEGDDLRAAVIAFAAEYEEDDHGSFVEDVFDADEFDRAEDLQADEELSNEVLDEDSELWEEAHS